MSKLKDTAQLGKVQQYQPLLNQQANGQSSLDYLYQAISLIETKNNTPNPYNGCNTSSTNNMNSQANNPVNLMNNLNQQLLLNSQQQNTDIQTKQNQIYNTSFILPASTSPTAEQMKQNHQHQHQRFYNPNTQQSQFSVFDYNLMFQQQMQKNQQQQQQMNCIDPYCTCNQNMVSIGNQSTKLATISNFISQHQDQQQQQQRQSLMAKQSINKTIKQRRNDYRANERRPTNSLMQVSSKAKSSASYNKKNISKLLQTGKNAELAIPIVPEPAKDYPNTKRVIPSRLEKAKQLARKHQNNLKLNLNQTNLQMIENHEGLLTPLSASSMSFSPNTSINSPGSVTSLSPISPHLTSNNNNNNKNLNDPGPLQQQRQTPASVFNYYPVEMMNNLMPLYMSPYLNNFNSSNSVAPSVPAQTNNKSSVSNLYQFPASKSANTTPPINNIDQLYFQNLVAAIYTIANYQQQQQHNLTNITQNCSGLIAGIQGLNKPIFNINNFNGNKPNQTTNAKFNSTNMSSNSTDIPHYVQRSKTKPASATPIRKSQSPVKTQQAKRKSTYKLISYIGDDIEAKVNEHFRRSLGSKYSKLINNLATTVSPSSIIDTAHDSDNKLVINENDDASRPMAVINENNTKEDWSELNNNNTDEFCDYNYVQNSPQSSDSSCTKSGGEQYEIDYESDENVIEDYVNEDDGEVAVTCDPLSPVSTSSYSYSIISHTCDTINEVEEEQRLNEHEYENVNSHEGVVAEEAKGQQQQILTMPIVST